MKSLITLIIFLSTSVCFADNSYFDWLSTRPETIFSRSYRSDSEILFDLHGPYDPIRSPHYDPTEDAAKSIIPSGKSSMQQVRPRFDLVDSGSILYYWEAKWSPEFQTGRAEINTHKAFMLGRGDDRRIEIRNRYSHVTATDIAKIDGRLYSFRTAIDNEPIAPQADEFIIQPNTWTHYWAEVQFDGTNSKFNLWVDDQHTDPIQLFDNLTIDTSGLLDSGLNRFWFEMNSSQERVAGDDLTWWFRNFAVMRDADAATIIGSAVPEPSSFFLFALIFIVFLYRR